MAETKVCTKCAKGLPLTSFHRDSRRADGRYPSCKRCKGKAGRRYYKQNKASLQIKSKHYASQNRDAKKAVKREYTRKYAKKSNTTAYKLKRIRNAIASGFKRIGVVGTSEDKNALKEGLLSLWADSMRTPCPLLCGRNLTPKIAAICHDMALSQGGAHAIGNIFLACRTCNNAQHSLPTTEYLVLRDVVISALGDGRWKKIRSWLAGGKH